MKRKEYQELTIEERVAKEKKKTKIVFIVVIMGILAIIGFFRLFGDAILDAMIPETPVYQLSEEEKKWLKPVFIDQDRVEEGKLLNYQIWEVEKGRYGLSVLNEKYPEYQFRITYLYIDSSFSNFTVEEKRTGECFSMYVSRNEDGSYEVEDNFYSYFFNVKYSSYLEEQLKEKIDRLVMVNAYFSNVKGKDYDINMTVDDIASGRLDAYPMVYFVLTAKNMTEEECQKYTEKIRKVLEDMNLKGSYEVLFWNLTEDEIELPGESEDIIYDEILSVTREEENG